MSKNYMEQVAQMLGVEFGEKFTVKCYETCEFYITENGLHCNRVELPTKIIFSNIMTGEEEIIKIPKRKHTGLEDVEAGDCIYRLFDTLNHLTALKKQELEPHGFADKTIRDNWERYIAIKKRLAKAASELNTEPIDWTTDGQEKWCIYYSVYKRDLDFISTYTVNDDGIYFTSKEAAQKAVEIVGKDDIIWMLRDFQAFIGYSREVAE